MTPTRLVLSLVVAGAILGGASLAYQHVRGPSTVAPAVTAHIAAVEATRAPDSIAHAQLAQQGATALTAGNASAVSSRRMRAQGDSLKHLQDSLANLAINATNASDSARYWRGAFLRADERATKYSLALDTAQRSIDSLRIASARYRSADSSSQDRLRRVDSLNTDLKQELERLSHRSCRILPGIPCPSRTQVLIAGGVGAAVMERNAIAEAVTSAAKHLIGR